MAPKSVAHNTTSGHDQENQASPATAVRESLHKPSVGKENHTLVATGWAESTRVQPPPEAGHRIPPGIQYIVVVDRISPSLTLGIHGACSVNEEPEQSVLDMKCC